VLPFSIAFSHGDPAGPQLEAAIQRAILSRQLPAASHVPGWRVVATELRVHPETVRDAFAALRKAGWLVGDDEQPVAALPSASAVEAVRTQLIRKRVQSLLADARLLGISVERISELLKEEKENERRVSD